MVVVVVVMSRLVVTGELQLMLVVLMVLMVLVMVQKLVVMVAVQLLPWVAV